MRVFNGNEGDMSYYTDIKNRNLIGLTQRLLKAGVLTRRACDGKFLAEISASWETPWVHVKQSYRSNCYLWKSIIFDHIVKINLPKDKWFVPAGCQECFKVVVRPITLKQLFELEEIERELNRPSKCGIEIRPSVFGNYGGYFYNRGLEEGLECYRIVRKAIDEGISPDVPVLLKRGCTEMEHGVGPSNEWDVSEDQLRLELRIKEHFAVDGVIISQTDDAVDHVHQTWIEKAYEWGDPTVFEYLDGVPLYPDYVTYQHLAENPPSEKDAGNSGGN
jgi:hypothetical protein